MASASAITSSPPTTRLSLLASARSMPSPRAATVGPSPAEPTRAFRTRSHLGVGDQGDRGLRAREHLAVGPALRRRARRHPRLRARCGAHRARRPARAAVRRCHGRPSSTTSSDSLAAITSSACVPIEPVDPAITILRIRMSVGGAPRPAGGRPLPGWRRRPGRRAAHPPRPGRTGCRRSRRSSAVASVDVQRRAVGTIGGHGVEGVAGEDDASAERDLLAPESIGIAGSVQRS